MSATMAVRAVRARVPAHAGGGHRLHNRHVRAARASWLPWAAWTLAGLACAVLWTALRSGPIAPSGEPLCALRRLAHVACPTCGVTRALALLAAGEWRASLTVHPWAVAMAAQLAGGWALWGAWLARRLPRRPDRWLPHAVAINAGALLALWLVRLATGTLPHV